MKSLIIHHLQNMWNSGLVKMGTSFEEQLEKVIDHLEENKYDRIIVSNFDSFEIEDEQLPLAKYGVKIEDFSYGWCFEGFSTLEEKIEAKKVISGGGIFTDRYKSKWAEGGSHSEIVIIPEWFDELVGEVSICGAFDGECIEDLEISLTSANIDYSRIEDLIT